MSSHKLSTVQVKMKAEFKHKAVPIPISPPFVMQDRDPSSDSPDVDMLVITEPTLSLAY